MGDAGCLKAATPQYRSHVNLSDVVRLGGRAEAKEVDADGNHFVRPTTWACSQRGQDVMPGTAVRAMHRKHSRLGERVRQLESQG